jgi:hypothetical protein
MTSLDETALTKLRFRLRGALYEPDQPEYAEACTLFNAMIERRPRLVARCVTPDDVVAAVAFTREPGLAIACGRGATRSRAYRSWTADS